MHRGWACADYHLRKAARDLLPEPAIRLLLPGADQPAPAGKQCAARSHYRAKQDRAAGRRRERPPLNFAAWYLLRRGANFGAFGPDRAELEFWNFSERIERRIGQEVGRRFRVAERHEHHVFRNVAIAAHLDL